MGRGSGELPLWLPLGLLATGGLLLLLARLVVFESVNGKYAVDLGFGTASWVLWVGIPLLVAGQLLILRANAPWATALAVGLGAGAMLTQLDLVLETMGLMLDADIDFNAGPGWWLALLGTVLLGTVVVLAIRRPPFRGRPAVQRTGRAAWAVILLFVALATWMSGLRGLLPLVRRERGGLPVARRRAAGGASRAEPGAAPDRPGGGDDPRRMARDHGARKLRP